MLQGRQSCVNSGLNPRSTQCASIHPCHAVLPAPFNVSSRLARSVSLSTSRRKAKGAGTLPALFHQHSDSWSIQAARHFLQSQIYVPASHLHYVGVLCRLVSELVCWRICGLCDHLATCAHGLLFGYASCITWSHFRRGMQTTTNVGSMLIPVRSLGTTFATVASCFTVRHDSCYFVRTS